MKICWPTVLRICIDYPELLILSTAVIVKMLWYMQPSLDVHLIKCIYHKDVPAFLGKLRPFSWEALKIRFQIFINFSIFLAWNCKRKTLLKQWLLYDSCLLKTVNLFWAYRKIWICFELTENLFWTYRKIISLVLLMLKSRQVDLPRKETHLDW